MSTVYIVYINKNSILYKDGKLDNAINNINSVLDISVVSVHEKTHLPTRNS